MPAKTRKKANKEPEAIPLAVPSANTIPEPLSRTVIIDKKGYDCEPFSTAYLDALNGAIDMQSDEAVADQVVYRLRSALRISDAAETIAEIICPKLIDEGIISVNDRKRYVFNIPREQVILLILQIGKIHYQDRYKELVEQGNADAAKLVAARITEYEKVVEENI